MVRFLKEVPQLIFPLVLVLGIMALVLNLLGAIPDRIHPLEHGPREYVSIAAAETDLGFEIVIPAYFSSYLSWPPARIYGQREPIPVVKTTYLARYGNSETLLVCQIVSDSEYLPVTLPWFDNIQQEIPVAIGEYEGVLLAGRGSDGRLLNGVYWKSDGFYFIVVTTRSAREILTIARSM
ncbi:hypothetical protein ACFLYX_02735 [Chloroflexota bacterium]